MTKVYLISSGVYSDYGINWAFSSREKAKSWLKILNKNHKNDTIYSKEYAIEEYDLDPEYQPRHWIWVSITQSGEAKVTNHQTTLTLEGENEVMMSSPIYDYDNNLLLFVQTDSEERAVKVANELRSRILSFGVWGKSVHQHWTSVQKSLDFSL